MKRNTTASINIDLPIMLFCGTSFVLRMLLTDAVSTVPTCCHYIIMARTPQHARLLPFIGRPVSMLVAFQCTPRVDFIRVSCPTKKSSYLNGCRRAPGAHLPGTLCQQLPRLSPDFIYRPVMFHSWTQILRLARACKSCCDPGNQF
eukprot:scaffold6655_cov169-Amphora_coffeaeformis.AAC.20